MNILLTGIMLFTSIITTGYALPSQQSGFNCAAVTEISQIECESLVALYNSTNGNNWVHHDNWLQNDDPSSWYGVSIQGIKEEDGKKVGGKVTVLYLDENGLTGTLPDLNLPNLYVAYLANNQIGGTISGLNLPSLYVAYLSHNRFSGLASDLNLPSLYGVYLYENQLSGPIPDLNLPSLTFAYLEYNQLSSLSSNSYLPNLATVYLSNNRLSGSIPNLNLPQIKTFYMDNNLLSGNIPESIIDLHSLTTFIVHENCLNTQGLSAALQTFLHTVAGQWETTQGGLGCPHMVSGKVLDAGGKPISGVTISDGNLAAADISAGGHTTTTASDGSYSLSLLAGSYTLKPTKKTFEFSPSSIQINLSAANINDQNFKGTKLPVILLPGIMGSNLYNTPQTGEICSSRPRGKIWFGIDNLSVLWLKADSTTPYNPCDQISAQDILDSGLADSYSGMLDKLQEEGYKTYKFPYDWRLDLDVNVSRLDQLIEEARSKEGVKQVILLGHSMGGLLARDYITDSSRAEKVAQVISVGSPYWGAPILAYAMRTGITGIWILDGFSWSLNARSEFKEILRNSSGAMELLPSPSFVEQYLPFYQVGSTRLDYEQSIRYFNATGQNARLLRNAQAFHARIDDFRSSNMNGVDYYILTSNNFHTDAIIREKPCRSGQDRQTCYDIPYYTLGDDTVPWTSARLWGKKGNWSGSAHVYTLSGVTNGHSRLMQDPVVQSQVLKILKCEASDSTDCAGYDFASAQADETASHPFIEVSVESDGKVSVLDGTNRSIDIDAEGNVVNQIPFSTYDHIDRSTIITLPANLTYTLTIDQTDGIPIQVQVTDFRMQSEDELFEPYQRTLFIDAPLASGGTAKVAVDYSQGLSQLQMLLDQDANGSTDTVVPLTSNLDQTQSQDYTPPVTTIQVSGTQTTPDYFTGLVIITLSSSDTDTGVLKTEYSLDGAKTWQTYSNPIQIVAEKVPVFYARSIDKAGNQEYPNESKALIPPTLYTFLPVVFR
jgi:pimeloyl-ACP methyl ester carboxylesterase